MRTALPPRRVGVGAVTLPPAFAQAQTDLANQVTAVITAGDSYLQANETANAIAAYKAAGQAGATSVGPEIDLAGMPNTTQRWTHQAWILNGQLQGFTAQSDAPSAQNLAKAMQAAYLNAIASAQEVASDASSPAALIATPGSWAFGVSEVIWGAAAAELIAALDSVGTPR